MRTTLAFSPDWNAVGNAPSAAFVDAWAGWLSDPGLGNDRLKMSGINVSIGRDAADDARAAAAPYTGWAGFNYASGLRRDRLRDVLVRCAQNDVRAVMIHRPDVLDLYDEVDRVVPLKGKRWVIAHVSTLSPRDIDRIVRMGVVLTTHTNGSLYKGLDVLTRRLPPERHREIVPLKSLLDAGVPVSLATDNTPVSLFLPVWQTIARTSFNTGRRVAPEQALTRTEALRCATANGAWLTFDEHERGSLQPGKLADLAVLSADPLAVAEPDIAAITSAMTMVGGKIAYQTPDWRRPAPDGGIEAGRGRAGPHGCGPRSHPRRDEEPESTRRSDQASPIRGDGLQPGRRLAQALFESGRTGHLERFRRLPFQAVRGCGRLAGLGVGHLSRRRS
jgi:hypothetical protein